jgi:DNA-binding NarL/FixJ family response regulator
MNTRGNSQRLGNGPVDESTGARIVVCSSDETLRARIEEILTLAGHQIADVSSSLESLVTAAPLSNLQLVVLVSDFEPFSPGADIGLVRARLGEVPLVIVATGTMGRAARKLVLSQVDGLLQVAELETALVGTVSCALANQLCFPAALREHLAQPVFSYREKQVLELVLAGLTNGEIAGRLYLSESTVKSHLASSFRKLGVSSRVEAARRVLDPDSPLDLGAPVVPDPSAPEARPEFV